jgi:hypothetical protein
VASVSKRAKRRSVKQLIADGRASSYADADGTMVLFGKRVSELKVEPAQIVWENGETLDFPDWDTLIAVLRKLGWEFGGIDGAGRA